MARLLFEKTGNAIWISHLDLMRLFQRAFKRAELPLKHTQGYNPRPSVSIALPLSVGVESHCELLDFELDGEVVSGEIIVQSLNRYLVDGVHVIDVVDSGRKIRDIALVNCSIILEYDGGVPENAPRRIEELLSRPSLIVPKRSKSGVQDQDIISMIRRFCIKEAGENSIVLDALICCQNPALNPAQIVSAISIFEPDLKPDFSKSIRNEIFDTEENVFR